WERAQERQRVDLDQAHAGGLEHDLARASWDLGRWFGADDRELLGLALGFGVGSRRLDAPLGRADRDLTALAGVEQFVRTVGSEGLASVLIHVRVALDRSGAHARDLGGLTRGRRALGVALAAAVLRSRWSAFGVEPKQLI